MRISSSTSLRSGIGRTYTVKRSAFSPRRRFPLPRAALLTVGFLRDLVLFELLVEIASGGADDLCGLRDVPVVLPELGDQKGPLAHFLELLQCARRQMVRRDRLIGVAYVVRKNVDADDLTAGHDEEPLHGIPQLADVALPRVFLQTLHSLGRESLLPQVILLRELLDEVRNERRDVLASLPQR